MIETKYLTLESTCQNSAGEPEAELSKYKNDHHGQKKVGFELHNIILILKTIYLSILCLILFLYIEEPSLLQENFVG